VLPRRAQADSRGEGHTPKEIQTGLPGAAIQTAAEPALAKIGWARRQATAAPDGAVQLPGMYGEMILLVEKIMADYMTQPPVDLE
jgi:hypothetical protein